jgi:DNA-binding transcriptional regulator YhcF (GntR family)
MSAEKKKREQPRIPVRLSMEDPEPMYRQIESQLRDLILGGHLPAGTKLPTIRALAVDLGCSVITTTRAYQDLEQEGFIRTRQGMGTLVSEMPKEKLSSYRREAVESAIREALQAGLRAGLQRKELREIVESILQETLQREEAANALEGGTS